MNKLLVPILLLGFFACNNKIKNQTPPIVTDNEELKRLYQEDQADRQSGNIDWTVVSERDKKRQERVYELLEADKVKTAQDYRNAAMIFQHGLDTVASGMAVKMMKKAIDLDPNINKWLYAAAVDRDLMRRGEPQIYGTQFYKKKREDPWERYDLDSTKVTDEERREYGVETLAQQREKLKRMNKKQLWELVEEGKTMDEIVAHIKNTEPDNSEYDLSEGGINRFGYELMGAGKDEEALKIFRLNTELYPKAYNTYDSLGECLLKLGKKEEAIRNYEKSLELNPNNQNAEKVISEIKDN